MFICGRVTVIIPQSYLPFYFTETLNMNKVMDFMSYWISVALSLMLLLETCSSLAMQISLAIGPLVLFISSGIFSFIVKEINKRLKEKVNVLSLKQTFQRCDLHIYFCLATVDDFLLWHCSGLGISVSEVICVFLLESACHQFLCKVKGTVT